MTAINKPPTPATRGPGMPRMWNSPTCVTRKYPATAFAVLHSTFTSGDDCPLPGGDANGVGNAYFFGGAFLVNAIPHFVQCVSGRSEIRMDIGPQPRLAELHRFSPLEGSGTERRQEDSKQWHHPTLPLLLNGALTAAFSAGTLRSATFRARTLGKSSRKTGLRKPIGRR